MSRVISSYDDVIDSRDVIERIEELSDEDYGPLDRDERIELKALHDLVRQATNYSDDWEYGATLIRDSYFIEYAKDYAEDIGAVSLDRVWPSNHIDWQAAAQELHQDYTSVEFDGVTYWLR